MSNYSDIKFAGTSAQEPPFRNLIINGDMSIAQRGTSTASVTTSGYYACDRWRAGIDTAGTWTISQDADVPNAQGFQKSTKVDCTTANGSLSAGSLFYIQQIFEGQNLQYLKKGTSSAESLTVSFWVKSVKTGTYICELKDDNNRTISKSYTINSASTWEKKTITFAGDTTGGAIANDNTGGLEISWWLVAGTTFTSGTLQTSWDSLTNANRAVGQVNLADNTANNFWITGVQLEAGTTASDFEFLPHDVNMQKCLRYYYLHASGLNKSFGAAAYYNSGYVIQASSYPVFMRATPSLEQVTGTGYYTFFRNSSSDAFDDFVLSVSGSTRTNEKFFEIYNSTDMSGTTGHGGFLRTNNASAYLAFDAEL